MKQSLREICDKVVAADAAGFLLPHLGDIAKKTNDLRFGDPVRLHVLQLKAADKHLSDLHAKFAQTGAIAVAHPLKAGTLDSLFGSSGASLPVSEAQKRKSNDEGISAVLKSSARFLACRRCEFLQVGVS
jgi:hypothetical protein